MDVSTTPLTKHVTIYSLADGENRHDASKCREGGSLDSDCRAGRAGASCADGYWMTYTQTCDEWGSCDYYCHKPENDCLNSNGISRSYAADGVHCDLAIPGTSYYLQGIRGGGRLAHVAKFGALWGSESSLARALNSSRETASACRSRMRAEDEIKCGSC